MQHSAEEDVSATSELRGRGVLSPSSLGTCASWGQTLTQRYHCLLEVF